MSALKEIHTDEEWNIHNDSLPTATLQIIYFHAPWAAPCKNMATVLETLASAYPVTEPLATSWVSLNAEELLDTSEFFDVTAVPFLVLTRNKQILETVSGSDATKVRTAIEKHASASSVPISSNGSAAVKSAAPNTNNINSNTNASNNSAAAPEQSSSAIQEDKEDLTVRLTNLVKAAPVMLFMKGTPSAPQCGFSRQTVAILRENSVKYGFFNILADDEVRQGMKEFADWPTFPQLWMDGELVGGLDILKEELKEDPDFFKAHSVAKPSVPASE